MALHGTVQANSEVLWQWVATRQSRQPDEVNVYRVELLQGSTPVAETMLWHRYADGSLVLATKVLQWCSFVQKQAEAGLMDAVSGREV